MKTSIKTKKEIKGLLKFAQEFAKIANTLSAGDTIPHIYSSDDCKFYIDYYNKIFEHGTRKELPMIARVNNKTGVIEISKSKLLKQKATPEYIFNMIINLYSTYKTNLKNENK